MIDLILAAAASAMGASADAPYESITGEDLARLIATLSDDSFEGRESGTAGGRRTTEFLARAFAARDVPPGIGGSYYQPVPLVQVTRDDIGSLSIARDGTTVTFAPGAEFVAFPGSASGAASITDAPLVFVGHGITAPEFGWDDYAGADVEDAIVVVLRGEPFREGDDDFFMGRDLTEHYQLSTKSRRAAENGAVGVILVHTEATAGWPWSLLESGGSSQVQMFLRDAPPEPKPRVAAQISEPAATRLFAEAGADFEALREHALASPFAAPLDATGSLAYRGTTGEVTTNNVVAMIRGREAPDECVVYTAHWDHVGINPALEGDRIHNGAVDNATGTAALLELAEAFRMMEPGPRRSVYFVATGAEEKGLLGAQYYAENSPCALGQTVAVLNMDSHFPFGSFRAMTVPGLGFTEIDESFARAAARVGRVLQADSNPEVGGFFRNDAYAFVERGVPAIYAVGSPLEEELTEGSEILARYIDYVTNRYHKPTDEYDPESWDMAGIVEDFRVFFDAGRLLAEDTRFPNFRYDLPWRMLRDSMQRD